MMKRRGDRAYVMASRLAEDPAGRRLRFRKLTWLSLAAQTSRDSGRAVVWLIHLIF